MNAEEIDGETTEYGKIAHPIGEGVKKGTTTRGDL
jgi:hypothetical protein